MPHISPASIPYHHLPYSLHESRIYDRVLYSQCLLRVYVNNSILLDVMRMQKFFLFKMEKVQVAANGAPKNNTSPKKKKKMFKMLAYIYKSRSITLIVPSVIAYSYKLAYCLFSIQLNTNKQHNTIPNNDKSFDYQELGKDFLFIFIPPLLAV